MHLRFRSLGPVCLVLFIFAATLLVSPSAARANDNDNWSNQFLIPGFESTIRAMVEFNGDLILGGDFTQVGELQTEGIVGWNGTNFFPLGGGLPGGVATLAVYNNELYAGGDFLLSPLNGVAVWDGNNWSGLDDGIDGCVEALAVYDTLLAVGGAFTEVGSGNLLSEGLAFWNGTNWIASNAGLVDPPTSLATYNGQLYVGGYFSDIGPGPLTVNGIARWNGSAWNQVGGGTDSGVEALYVLGSNLIVAGDFTAVGFGGSVASESVAQWNGTSWSTLGGGVSGIIPRSIGERNGDLIVGDLQGQLHQWNGSVWSIFADFEGDFLQFMEAQIEYGGNYYVGGLFQRVGNVAVYGFACRNVSDWFAPLGGQGLSGSVYGLEVLGANLGISGDFQTAGSSVAYDLVTYDGSLFSLGFAGGIPNGNIAYAMLADGPDTIVGGDFSDVGSTAVPASNIARWNGSWNAIGVGFDGEVRALELYGGDIIAGGAFVNALDGPTAVNGIARWNGTSWQAFGAGLAGGTASIDDMILFGGNLIVGGSFNMIDGVAAENIAMWNGTSWLPLGLGVNARVQSLEIHGGNLWVGGNFNAAGGFAAQRLASWNGSAWSVVIPGPDGNVQTMASYMGELYIGGAISQIGLQLFNSVARYNGSVWSALGDGLNDEVHTMEVFNEVLYVGGDFTQAGLKPSFRLAAWDFNQTSVPEPKVTNAFRLSAPLPNPFRAATQWELGLDQPGLVQVAVFDARGARVAQLLDQELSPGQHLLRWDGTDAQGRAVAPGVYYLTVRQGEAQTTRKAVLIR